MGKDQEKAKSLDPRIRSFENIVPRRRNRRGDPVPRRYVSAPTLVTHDPEALLETARTLARSSEEGARLFPWLKCRAALAADANMQNVRRQLLDRMARHNESAKLEMASLEKAKDATERDVARLAGEAVSIVARLGLSRAPGESMLPMRDDEPVSLEALSGDLSVPPPQLAVGWFERFGYKLLSAVGGGGLFGLSLGLLSEKIELYSLAEEWPVLLLFVTFGVLLMAILGGVTIPLGRSLGGSLYGHSLRLGWVRTVAVVLTLSLLCSFCWAVIVIESRVEQLGLFKLVAETSTLQGAHVTRSDMLWVSLMLVIPVVGLYVVSGLAEGERTSNIAYLVSEQARRRTRLAQDPLFAEAASKLEILRFTMSSLAETNNEIARLRSAVRGGLTTDERMQIEDLQMDVMAHSQEAEQAVLSAASGKSPRGRWGWKHGIVDGSAGATVNGKERI